MPDVKENLKKGQRAGDNSFKLHLDGYSMLDYCESGAKGAGPGHEIFYFTDVGELAAIRRGNYELHFMIQETRGFDVWKNSCSSATRSQPQNCFCLNRPLYLAYA